MIWIDRVVAVLLHAGRQAEAAEVLARGMERGDLPPCLSTARAERPWRDMRAQPAAATR